MQLAGIDELIWSRKGYHSERPCIVGTGISIQGIGALWSQGLTVEEIAFEKSISLEWACAGVAYYLHNREAFDTYAELESELMDRVAEEYKARGHDPVVFRDLPPGPALGPFEGVGTLIECRPGYHGGRSHITGTGISVGRVGVLWTQGYSVGEIAYQKSITLEQACAALAYYLHNRLAIDEDLRQQDEETDRLGEEHYRKYGFPV